MKNLIILEVLLFFSIFVFAEGSVTFSKYETEHQILYFSSNLDPSVIDRLIADAERSEEFIKALYGWVPKKRSLLCTTERPTRQTAGQMRL